MNRIRLSILFTLLFIGNCFARDWFVDSSNSGTHNGQTWATAWANVTAVSGVAAGDRVLISGGPSGNTQTYPVSSWQPAGNTGNHITYQIGQDSAHNGTAIFSGSGPWLTAASGVNISGDAGDGQMHFQLANYTSGINGNSGPTIANSRFSYINFGNFMTGVSAGNNILWFVLSQGLVIDHCLIGSGGSTTDCEVQFASPRGGNGFGTCCIFTNNIINCRSHSIWDTYSNPALDDSGADGIRLGGGGGFIIAHNIILGYRPILATGINDGVTDGQHQDLIQCFGSPAWIQIYDNYFGASRVTDSYLQLDGTSTEIYVINNIYQWGSIGIDGNPGVNSHIFYVNNLILDEVQDKIGGQTNHNTGVGQGINMNSGGNWTDSWCLNNGFFNLNGGSIVSLDSHIINVANVLAPSSSYFAGYIFADTNSNNHLSASAVNFIGKGTNLTSLIALHAGLAPAAFDFDGNPRPTTGAWDIGPYQFSTNSTPSSPPVLTILPFNRFGRF